MKFRILIVQVINARDFALFNTYKLLHHMVWRSVLYTYFFAVIYIMVGYLQHVQSIQPVFWRLQFYF